MIPIHNYTSRSPVDFNTSDSPTFGKNGRLMSDAVEKLFEWFDKSEAFVQFRSETASVAYRDRMGRLLTKPQRIPVQQKAPVQPVTSAPSEASAQIKPPVQNSIPVQPVSSTQATVSVPQKPSLQDRTPQSQNNKAVSQHSSKESQPAAVRTDTPEQPQPAAVRADTPEQSLPAAVHTDTPEQPQPAAVHTRTDTPGQSLPTVVRADTSGQSLPAAVRTDTPGQYVPGQVEILCVNLSEQIEKFCEIMSSQAIRFESITAAGQASLTKAIAGINSSNLPGGESLHRLESAAGALTAGVSALEGYLRQSSSIIQAQNQTMLDGIEGSLKSLADKLSSNITAALDSNNIPDIKAIEDPDQSANNIQALNQALLDGFEDIFDRHTEKISKGISSALDSNNKLGAYITNTVKRFDESSLEQSKKTSELLSGLMTGISDQLSSIVNNAVTAIAESINSADSNKIAMTDQLVARTERLADEYEHYFSGIEHSTASIISNMDSTVTNTILGLSEQMSAAMNVFRESLVSALERFEKSAENMVTQFEEQSRDIGLYAREINHDVNALSTNLRESVTVFNKGLNESVKDTFDEIDEGLSDMTLRFANTLEAIQDSVDALPFIDAAAAAKGS